MSQADIFTKFQTSDKHLPPKQKISKEWFSDTPQRYSGEILNNIIHGNGFYFIQKDEKFFYDGLFYANKLEGYSQIFYGDSSHFQGLFKDHKRLGPGILTYSNGEQDVGLWNGFSLARLETVVHPNVIPLLGNSTAGKLKLVRYRYLVPVCPSDEDIATSMLKDLLANERLLKESYKLYNLDIENKNNLFFNKRMFDEKFYTTQDCLIDILAPEEEEEEEMEVKFDLHDEECIKALNTDTSRISQISDELEVIACKLEEIRRIKYLVERKVEYCRFCCFGSPGEEYTSPKQPTAVEEESSYSARAFSLKAQSDSTPLFPYLHFDEENSSYETVECEKNFESQSARGTESYKEDSMLKIEDYLIDQCDCHEAMHIDDLSNLEKQLDAIRKDELFYETIKSSLQEKLKYHLKKSEMCSTIITKQILVNDLLAWNNEELSVTMLKHCFLHRRSEYMVTFNVSSLLKGNRDDFSTPGTHERNCIEFLTNCASGAIKKLLDTIRKNKIDVNLCDARGNSGVFFATANGHIDVLPILANFGAKLDQVNDEGLTPLSLCLLIYLAIHHNRLDWETSFLPEFSPPLEEQTDLPKWGQVKSLLNLPCDSQSITRPSLATQSFLTTCENRLLGMRNQKPSAQTINETYLFDTTFKDYKEPKKKGKPKSKPSKKQPVEEPPPPSAVEPKNEGVRLAEYTIERLLEYGANPNTGEVPLPCLLLAIFSENSNLVKDLLTAKADVNVTMTDCMTGLHVVASLKCAQENIDICRTLLEFHGDPNLRTSVNHWPERKLMVLGKGVKVEDYEDIGKNPFHILCLRNDFPTDACDYFSNLATLFIKHGIKPNDTYLGHTVLSLAVLTGNLKVVETLLKLKPIPIDPHLQLEYNMGNVLTIHILKRYNSILSLEKSIEMLKLLLDLGANPLRPVGEFENAIAFMEKEHEIIKVEKGKKKGGKKEKSSNDSKKSSKSMKQKPKKGKKGKQPSQEVLKEYLKELARYTIIKYAQFVAVENLYNLVEADMMNYNFTKVLAEFLTPPTTIEILAALFNHGRIKQARFNKDICLQVIEFVEKYQKVVKGKKGKKDKKEKKKGKEKKGKKGKSASSKGSSTKDTIPEPPPPTFSDILDATNFELFPKDHSKIKLKRPGLDNVSKYIVCFHCLKKLDKVLLLCPRCQYVYYCSEQCNKLNIKMKGLHSCNMNFYKAQKQRWEAGDVPFPENLHEICKMASQKCELMLVRRQEEELEKQRQQLEEEKRLDIYGTRFLKKPEEKRRVSLKSFLTSGTASVATSLCFTDRIEMTPFGKILTRLSGRDEKYADMVNQRHESSLKVPTQVETIKKEKRKKRAEKHSSCICVTHKVEESEEIRLKLNKISPRKMYKELIPKFEAANVVMDPDQIIRKLRKIPSKYQYFIELLSTYFPDVDLSFLFLPYACYCNGHLYYKFLDDNIFSKTYSMV